MPELTSYAPAWRAYRLWSRAFWLTFVGYLPAMSLADRFVRRSYGDVANTTTLVVALAWMLGFLVTGYQKGNLTCPRCGQMFFRSWDDRPWRRTWRSNPFTRRCLHCGLPKWSDDPEERQPP